MAYTSPSYIGNAIWNNAAGSPVISPSRWQTQVLDNLCALAAHDHSGCPGAGASTLSSSLVTFGGMREVISPFFPSASNGWNLDVPRANWPGGGAMSASTVGASIAYDVYLSPGIHTVQFFYGKGSAFGIITGCLSGASTISSTSSIDGWKSGTESAPSGIGAFSQLGEFRFRVYTAQEQLTLGSAIGNDPVGGGRYELKFRVTASGASSTGYGVRLGYMYIQ